MKDSIKSVLNKETLSYLFFGVLTTLVNYITFVIGLIIFGEKNTLTVNTIAFIAATIFAYITNKIWVFNSKSWDIEILKSEIISFLGVRIISFLFEQLGLLICISIFNVGNYYIFSMSGIMISKVILSFIVVILNYVVSKFFIFKDKIKE
ncbi:GtrA family protein [Paraclostridium ghonii]|uniref:GtrA family protein n=1 Tax=Paraclostridium ghonii TaxID=29358 RepID=UPI00202D0888|nr:GtrA family protein [Paeniclostridium ghonii]